MESRMVIPATAQRSDTGLSGIPCPDEETLNSHKEIFFSICRRLSNTIQQQKPIQDRELFDFSKTVIWIIRDSMTSRSSVLDGLSGQISDYWHFEANTDTNFKRKHSYIRLYQMVTLLQSFAHEQEQKQKVLVALRENMQNMKTISFLHSYPGITRRKLREILGLSSEELQAQLDTLKKERFLTSRRSGEEQYYMLTSDGEALYGELHIQERKTRAARARRELLDGILQIILQSEMKSYQIISVFEYLQNCSNAELVQFLWLLRQYRYKMPTPARTNHYEETSQWMSAPPIKDIMLQQHNFVQLQPYQRKVIKENLVASKKYIASRFI